MNEKQIEGINAYTHWLWNASPDFVEVAWKNNPMMALHLREKLIGFMNRYGRYMSLEALTRFTRELDSENTEVLFKYIIENHTNKW